MVKGRLSRFFLEAEEKEPRSDGLSEDSESSEDEDEGDEGVDDLFGRVGALRGRRAVLRPLSSSVLVFDAPDPFLRVRREDADLPWSPAWLGFLP